MALLFERASIEPLSQEDWLKNWEKLRRLSVTISCNHKKHLRQAIAEANDWLRLEQNYFCLNYERDGHKWFFVFPFIFPTLVWSHYKNLDVSFDTLTWLYLESAAAGLSKESKGAGRIDGMLSGQDSVTRDTGLPEPGQRDLAATFPLNWCRIGGGIAWRRGGHGGKGERRLLLLTVAILARSSGSCRRWGSGVVLLQGAEWRILSRVCNGRRRRRIANGNWCARGQRCIGQGYVALGRCVLAALEPLQRALLAADPANTVGGVHTVHPLVEKLLNTLHDSFWLRFLLLLRVSYTITFIFRLKSQSKGKSRRWALLFLKQIRGFVSSQPQIDKVLRLLDRNVLFLFSSERERVCVCVCVCEILHPAGCSHTNALGIYLYGFHIWWWQFGCGLGSRCLWLSISATRRMINFKLTACSLHFN